MDKASLGTPSSTTIYGLCMYDSVADVPALAAFAHITPSLAWAGKPSSGWSYKDKAGIADGITQIKLKSGAAGKTSAQVKGKGASLLIPSTGGGTTFSLEPSVTVQLVNSDGQCWSSVFTSATKNDNTQFAAKGR